MLNQKNYFSNLVRHAKGGVIQCASAEGGSCGKSVGVGFVGGAAVGGGAGAWGSGALASMNGGFAGGVTGSALNGGDGWDVLKGGLMGAGIAYASGWVEDFFPVKFKSETSLGVDGNFDPEQGAKKIDYASEINVKDRNSIKVLKSREAFSQERVMAQEHLKNIGDRHFEYLGAYEVKTGKLACPECLTTDYSENSVTTNRSINNALRWNSGVRLIHNQPRTMIPSANDYIGASMFRNSSLYIIHTNSSAIFKNGLYQFTSSPDNAKNTLQHIYY
jgi:hypothetical protein